jgi:hypothetical protein
MKRLLALLLSLASLGVAQAATCVTAAAGSPLTITLNFVPPTTNSDGSPVTLPLTYNVYMGTTSGGETQLSTGITASPTSISAGLVGGNTYYVEMAAVDANGVSAKSNEACKTFALAPVTITTTALASGTVGEAYSFKCISTGGTATWAATGLPAGLTMSSTQGAISGTPTAAGTSSVKLTVTPTTGAAVSVTLPLLVNPAPPPGSITITRT